MEKYTEHQFVCVCRPNTKSEKDFHERVPNQSFTMQTLQNQYERNEFLGCVEVWPGIVAWKMGLQTIFSWLGIHLGSKRQSGRH
jgi:hypothetical protein